MKRICNTVIFGSLLLALYVVIFSFSAQTGEESGGLSALVSEICAEFLNKITGKNWTDAFVKSLAQYFEHPIRKLAHFGEYAIMSILLYLLWRQWMERGKKLYKLVIVWVFVSAALDEFHQLFVPDRYGSFWDVLLDTCGGIFGIFVLIWLEKREIISIVHSKVPKSIEDRKK